MFVTTQRILLLSGLLLVLVAVAVAWGAGWIAQPAGEAEPVTTSGAAAGFSGRAIDPPLPAPDFTMVDHRRRPFTLSERRGQVVVLFFGYTNCPDVCPATLGQFKRVKLLLGDEAEQVQFLFITVDPEYDTPERLAAYVGAVGDDFLGLWASPEGLQPVLDAYGVFVEKTPADTSPAGYWITHTASSYVIDRGGRLRLQEPFGAAPETVADDLRALVREPFDGGEPDAGIASPVGIEGVWARPGMEGGNSSVYFALKNRGDRVVRLESARAQVAARTEIHRTVLEERVAADGSTQQVMRMQPAGIVQLGPEEQVVFRPGGLHVMLLGLREDLAEGDRIQVTLSFQGAPPVALEVPVMASTEAGQGGSMGSRTGASNGH